MLHGGNESDCLHAPWSLPLVMFSALFLLNLYIATSVSLRLRIIGRARPILFERFYQEEGTVSGGEKTPFNRLEQDYICKT